MPLPSPSTSNLRVKNFPVGADSILLDTTSILPGSLQIRDVDSSTFRLDFIRAILYWKTKPQAEFVTITYRVFPYHLNAVYKRFDYDSVLNNVYLRPFEFNPNGNESGKGLLDFGNIQASGSL